MRPRRTAHSSGDVVPTTAYQWVVDKGLKKDQKQLLGIPQRRQHFLGLLPKAALHAGNAERVLENGAQSVGHALGHAQIGALVEADVVVNVHHLARGQVQQEIVEMAIAQANNVANHACHSHAVGKAPLHLEPLCCTAAQCPHLPSHELPWSLGCKVAIHLQRNRMAAAGQNEIRERG